MPFKAGTTCRVLLDALTRDALSPIGSCLPLRSSGVSIAQLRVPLLDRDNVEDARSLQRRLG
jgi:hypothetical protein